MIINLKDVPAISRLVKIVSPKYRKHKAIVFERDTYTNNGSQWDGGSRQYAAFVYSDGTTATVPGQSSPEQFGGCGPVTVDIPENGAIVVLGIFRGKPATASVYVKPGTLDNK